MNTVAQIAHGQTQQLIGLVPRAKVNVALSEIAQMASSIDALSTMQLACGDPADEAALGVAVRVLAANVGFMADLLGANSRGAPGDATRWLLPPALADMKADRA